MLTSKIISNKINNYNEIKKIENYFQYNYKKLDSINKNTDYEMIIEIPKINLKKGLYNKESQYNNINYNIEILKESTMPNIKNSTLILASHSGNSDISYFKKLYKLEINDFIYVYYDNKKYIYKITNFYEIKKGELIIINQLEQGHVLLITCNKNKKNYQLIFEAIKLS